MLKQICRPSKRSKSAQLDFKDLRAIPFVGFESAKTKCSWILV
jgi:hypothetical protein